MKQEKTRQTIQFLKIIFLIFMIGLTVGCAGYKATGILDERAGRSSSGEVIMAEPAYPEVAVGAPGMEADESYSRKNMIYPAPMPPYQETEGDITTDRKIIKTASLSVEVDDYDAAAIKVMNLAQKYSGFVTDSSAYTDKNGKKKGHINIRIPSEHFDAALIETGTFGKVKSQTTGGNDVTEEYIDLKARLNNSRKEEERLQTILTKAEDVNDILRVEREISRVRGEIERLQGRIQYMDNHVSFSSLQIEIYEPTPVVKESGLYKAFKDAINLALGTIRFLIRALGLLLPLILLGMIAVLIILGFRRRNKGRRKGR